MTPGSLSDTLPAMTRGRPRIHKRKASLYGKNLARFRSKSTLTQGDLADLTGGIVSQGDVSRLESGEVQEPSATQIKAMADALGVPVADFWADHDMDVVPLSETLKAFVESGVASDVTQEEMDFLRQARFPSGTPTVKTYLFLLEAKRSAAEPAKQTPSQ